MAKSNFIVRGGADFSAIPKELQKLQGQFNGFSKSIGAGLKIAAASTIIKGLINFGKEALQVASDLQEVQNVVDVTFGSMSNEVNNFASNALKQFGLSELSAKKFTSTMGAMLKSSGLSATAAKDMSIEMAKLTADMASFYNLDADEAFTKIQSGLSGEIEPLKRLGINMNVANMEAYAMAQGINKAWKEMSQAEQTMLRYNYLLSVTGDAQGDFARTSGSWANQTKLLKEQWKEFMGLIGQALTQILLPIVKGLNKMLEFLINITKEIGKIYTMVTGKEIAVESNNNIADTAMDAADGEENLADGIGKAAKAAKKALAPFDELNVLQSNLNDGDNSNNGNMGIGKNNGLNTTMTTTTVDAGPDKSKWEDFFVWFGDKWRGLRQTLEMPILVPAPVFAALPSPIWKPNYGLEGVPTFVPAPAFESLPNPIWKPNWNIAESLQIATNAGLQSFGIFKTGLAFDMGELVTSISTSASTLKKNVVTSAQEMFVNNSMIFTNMKTNAIGNMESTKESLIFNAQEMQRGVTYAVALMAMSAAGSIYQMGSNGIANMNSMFNSTYASLGNWINSTTSSFANWGNGMIQTVANTSNGMANSFVSGLKTMYDKFKEFARATGEKISGSFSGSFSIPAPKSISPVGVAIGALTLLQGALRVPRMAFGAYATGGIIDKPTLAMMGEGGKKEVVMPMQSNTGWISELAAMIIGAMPVQGGGGDITIHNNIDLDGEPVFRSIRKFSKEYYNRTGESPFPT